MNNYIIGILMQYVAKVVRKNRTAPRIGYNARSGIYYVTSFSYVRAMWES